MPHIKFTRDSAIWWFGMIAGAASYLAAHMNAFPIIPASWQGTVETIAAALTWLSGYLRMSPRPLSLDSPMAGTADSSQTLTIVGHQKE